MWVLILAAEVAQKSLAAARKGKPAGGTSILEGFMLGWALTGIAFAWDNSELVGPKLPPYGFWVVFVLHAGFGSWALIYFVYATVTLRKLEFKRNDKSPTRQSSGPPESGR
jgi:hypothetical protein